VPLVETDVGNMVDSMSSGDKAFRYFADWGYNTANKLVPAIVKNVIRTTNKTAGVGDQNLDDIDIGLPKTGIGRKIGRQYGLDGNQDIANDYIRLFYNKLKVIN